MTGPRWPRTCSHPIYARTLTGVYQVVRMFSPCYFHVINIIVAISWLPPLTSQLFSLRLFKVAPSFYSLAVFVQILLLFELYKGWPIDEFGVCFYLHFFISIQQ